MKWSSTGARCRQGMPRSWGSHQLLSFCFWLWLDAFRGGSCAVLIGSLPLRLLHHVRAPSEMAGVSRAVAVQLDTLRYGMRIYSGDPCRIARLVGMRKCTEVCTMMKSVSAPPDSAPSSPPLGPARRMGSKRKPVAPQRRKNASQVLSAIP